MRRFLGIFVREVLLVALFAAILVAFAADSVHVAMVPDLDPIVTTPTPTAAPTPWDPEANSLPSKRGKVVIQTPACAQDIKAFVPVRLTIEQVGLDITLTAQPLGAGDTLPVPISPHRAVNATTGAWWKDGAQPGSGAGVVEIGTHTFSAGYDAAGNKVLRVAPGAIAKLYDAAGTLGACYSFDRRVDVQPADLPPSDVWRSDGTPGLAIAACDDLDSKSKSYGVRAYHIWKQIP